jgi:CubicO group peptidase (beta-lactamase class C family)
MRLTALCHFLLRQLPVPAFRHALISLIILSLAFSAGAQRKHQPANPFAGLDTAFARIIKDWHAAGFAVAVIKKDSVIYSKGFGYRDLENKLPVTPRTLFAIGSCTKAFTSSLIGLLNQEGRLDIDKPVRNYLPELQFYNETMDNSITLRDMMCHRTGLPRHDFAWYLFESGSRDSLIRRVQFMEPTAGVREKWQYNNFMFLAQGVVVQKLTGNSWESNVSERLFKPLGMTASGFSVKDLQKGGDVAFGYGVKKDSIIDKLDYHDLAQIAPAGAINSNVIDMAAWVTTWINGGKYRGKEILPVSYVNEAMSAQMVSAAGVPSKESPDVFFSSYGFGWMLSSYRGHYRVEHGGNIDGFSASTCFFPSDSIGIVVLSNQNGSQVPPIVRNLISDRLLHLGYKDWNTWLKGISDKGRAAAKEAASAKISDRKPGTSPSHSPGDYAGIYSNPGYGSFEVILQKDSLLADFPHQTWWLKHYHYDVFEPFDKDPTTGIDTIAGSPFKVQFTMDQAGNINGILVNIEPALKKPILFTRTPKPEEVSAANLQKYVGEYSIANVTTRVYIKNGTILYLFVPGQPEYELLPIGKDKFALKTLSGYEAQFIVNDKDEVTGLLAIQPNGTFKAIKKK